MKRRYIEKITLFTANFIENNERYKQFFSISGKMYARMYVRKRNKNRRYWKLSYIYK